MRLVYEKYIEGSIKVLPVLTSEELVAVPVGATGAIVAKPAEVTLFHMIWYCTIWKRTHQNQLRIGL